MKDEGERRAGVTGTARLQCSSDSRGKGKNVINETWTAALQCSHPVGRVSPCPLPDGLEDEVCEVVCFSRLFLVYNELIRTCPHHKPRNIG